MASGTLNPTSGIQYISWAAGYTGPPNTYAAFRVVSPVTVAPSPQTPPTAAGLEPAAYEANPYGKIRPKFIGGQAWMAGRYIDGPYFAYDVGDVGKTNPLLTAVIDLAEAANPGGTREITKLAIRGAEVAFDVGTGALADAKYAGATVEFRTGTSPQSPFQQVIDRNGINAIGYPRGIQIAISRLPLRPSAGMVPLISGFIEDSSFGDPADGITYNQILEVILRDCRYADSEFDVDVQRTYAGAILANASDLITFLQNERKIIVHMGITFTDKVRIVEPTTLSVDAEITNDNAVRGTLGFTKTDSTASVRKIQSTYIDKDRDYQMNVVTAQEDVFPYPATSAVQTENVERAVISDASQETSDAHIALYERIAVRSHMQAMLLTSMFGTEVGDGARYADHAVIGFFGRVLETQHDYDKFQVQITAGEVLNCGVEDDTGGAVTFDSNTFLARGAALTGVSDSPQFILSFWLNNTTEDSLSPQMILVTTPNFNFYVELNNGLFCNIFNAAQDHSIAFGFQTSFADFTSWTHILFAVDVTTGGGATPWTDRLFMYVNDVRVSGADFGQSGNPATGFNIGFSSNETEFEVGGQEGAGSYQGDMAEMYFAPGQYLDFTIEANRRKFITALGKPADLGVDGSTPTGTAPALYLRGGAADFSTNLGTGGTVTVGDGALTDAATTPFD